MRGFAHTTPQGALNSYESCLSSVSDIMLEQQEQLPNYRAILLHHKSYQK
jgi:hypothetical protein